MSRHDRSANRGHGRGRGGNLAIVAPPPPNVAAAADSQAEVSPSSPSAHTGNAKWPDAELIKMLTALRDYVKDNGLPANTHQSGVERSNAAVVVPVGWTTVARATSNTALQTMRKFDNLKTLVKDLFMFIKQHWNSILTEVAAELTTHSPEQQEETFDYLKLHYRVIDSYPFGFTFDEENEPKTQLDTAVLHCIEQYAAGRRTKWLLYIQEVVPLFVQINDYAGAYPKRTTAAVRSKRRPEEKHFELSSEDRDMMEIEVTSPAVSSNSESTSNSQNSSRRRQRTTDTASIAQSMQDLAEQTRSLSQTIHLSLYVKQLDERFISLDELIRKAKISNEEAGIFESADITELSDLLICDKDWLKRVLSDQSYSRLKALTSNTNLNLP